MSSNRTIVMLPGRLKGMGTEADCTVGTTEISAPGSGLKRYTKSTIDWVSADLPDGDYEVTYGGQTDKVRKRDGDWFARW